MKAKEIVVISGKGGTGKTSLTASLIPYFDNIVLADCDVDAPDLNILFENEIVDTEDFFGFQRPVIDYDKCVKCGRCVTNCNFNAITEDIVIKDGKCEGCTVCQLVCQADAISMHDYKIGEIYTRTTNYGTMVDARLIPGEESSGKLVSEVRKRAIDIAHQEHRETILIDGSPGIACNVISAVTGADKVLIVTEPSMSGLHDLKRVVQLLHTFSLTPKVIINKVDVSFTLAKQIHEFCDEVGIEVIAEIPFTDAFVKSISDKIIPSNTDIPFFKGQQWKRLLEYLKG